MRLCAAGDAPPMGGGFHAIHMSTPDDVDPEALAAAPMHYRDGAHDRFDRAPEDVRLM